MYETASDRAAFMGDFGSAVTGAHEFDAVFDNEYVEVGDIQGVKPILTAAYVSPVTLLATGDSLTVEKTDYTVVRIEKDGTGWCTIILEEQ